MKAGPLFHRTGRSSSTTRCRAGVYRQAHPHTQQSMQQPVELKVLEAAGEPLPCLQVAGVETKGAYESVGLKGMLQGAHRQAARLKGGRARMPTLCLRPHCTCATAVLSQGALAASPLPCSTSSSLLCGIQGRRPIDLHVRSADAPLESERRTRFAGVAKGDRVLPDRHARPHPSACARPGIGPFVRGAPSEAADHVNHGEGGVRFAQHLARGCWSCCCWGCGGGEAAAGSGCTAVGTPAVGEAWRADVGRGHQGRVGPCTHARRASVRIGRPWHACTLPAVDVDAVAPCRR